MNSRERQLAAIRHEVPDRLPVDAISVENQPEIARYLGIRPDEVLDALGLDGRIVAAGYTGVLPPPVDGMGWTEWGVLNTGDYGTAHAYPFSSSTTVADIERFPWPPLSQYDFESARRAASNLGGKYAVRGPYWRPLFCRVCEMFGMEEAMVKMSLEPAVFEAALEHVFQWAMDYCRTLLDACGDDMPIFCLGDDFATQRGLMISPEDWRRFLKPRFARLFALGKERGKHVWFHSCGDITGILPDLIDIGVDVWETVQLHTLPMSPAELKREYGRHLTFFGAVNTQRLPFASPREVQEDVLRCIEVLGKGGGYICGPDHHIKPDVSADNAVTLFRTAVAFRREGYTA